MLPCPPEGRAARRDRLIVRLIAEGQTVADLANLTGLSGRHIRRIVAAAPGASPARPIACESRRAPREVRCTGPFLEHLSSLRTDRRRNGRLYFAG